MAKFISTAEITERLAAIAAGAARRRLDEIEAAQEEDRQDAEAAWLVYRDQFMRNHPRRQLRRREFIAGFLAGRQF